MACWRIELRGLNALAQAEVVGRVIWDDGTGLGFEGIPEDQFSHGIVGSDPGRGLIYPADGREFFEALPHELRGTYLWATLPLRIDRRPDAPGGPGLMDTAPRRA